jgi:hypothetical protein
MTPPDNHTYDFTSHPLEEIIDMDDKMAGRSVELSHPLIFHTNEKV